MKSKEEFAKVLISLVTQNKKLLPMLSEPAFPEELAHELVFCTSDREILVRIAINQEFDRFTRQEALSRLSYLRIDFNLFMMMFKHYPSEALTCYNVLLDDSDSDFSLSAVFALVVNQIDGVLTDRSLESFFRHVKKERPEFFKKHIQKHPLYLEVTHATLNIPTYDIP